MRPTQSNRPAAADLPHDEPAGWQLVHSTPTRPYTLTGPYHLSMEESP